MRFKQAFLLFITLHHGLDDDTTFVCVKTLLTFLKFVGKAAGLTLSVFYLIQGVNYIFINIKCTLSKCMYSTIYMYYSIQKQVLVQIDCKQTK